MLAERHSFRGNSRGKHDFRRQAYRLLSRAVIASWECGKEIRDKAEVCESCGTRRTGPFCQQCGQHADTAHHSVRKLLLEAAEHLFNADGKVFSTLRGMPLHPATLQMTFLAGKRRAQVPPVQLYFVMLVVFLFIADHNIHVRFNLRTPEQAARMPQWMRWIDPVSRRINDNGGDFLDCCVRVPNIRIIDGAGRGFAPVGTERVAVERRCQRDGSLFIYNPTTKAMGTPVAFGTSTGAAPRLV